uniref:Profilin n=1 Tax=Arcella intermedia TaxID=1963864 RepID=A0A6B2LSA1_9EUKA
MTWQDYVDKCLIGSRKVSKASIFSPSGALWATSSNFNITYSEIKNLIQGFNDPAELRQYGLFLDHHKYLILRADDRSIYAKKDKGGVVAVKTGKAVLVCDYDDTIQPGSCSKLVEQLADYLIEMGF